MSPLASQGLKPVQFQLAIDHAPPKVRRYGLRDAHVRPLVSHGKRGGVFGGSFRVAPWEAWDFPSIELRAANTWTAIILDLDGRETSMRYLAMRDRGEAPRFSWLVERK